MYPRRQPMYYNSNNGIMKQSIGTRILRNIPGGSYVNGLILKLRRIRRVCRPIFPIAIRVLLVLLTAFHLQPFTLQFHLATTTIGIISRLSLMTALITSLLSIIFFDTQLFNYITIISLFIQSITTLNKHQETVILLLKKMMFTIFHISCILLSTLVGRRRSITKPCTLRKKSYLINLKSTLRHVDVLDAAIRLQASILTLDYALGVSKTICAFSLPFVIPFSFGYSTHNNGTVVLLLLICFTCFVHKSPLLEFNAVHSTATICGTLLTLTVGPGLLSVDEWIATANQLCY